MPTLKVTAEVSPGAWCNFRFNKPFKIGRLKDCDVSIDNTFVSRSHAAVVFEDGQWTIRDLESANGLFVKGERVPSQVILGLTFVRFGIEGPEVKFDVERPLPEAVTVAKTSRKVLPGATATKSSRIKDPALARYIEHYFVKPDAAEPGGEHTMFIRQAFAQVETKQKRRFGVVIVALLAVGLAAGAVAYYEHRQLLQERATAEELFYAIKSQDIDLANLDRALGNTDSQAGVEELSKFRARREEMEKNYDKYLATLHTYNSSMTERRRLVLRVARLFGECELEMPADFEAEINRYIDRWKSTGRLKDAVMIARRNGYAQTIAHEFTARGLPPQFFYLALQESNFNTNAVGPHTRMGFAKGMWQFIPPTGAKYHLHVSNLDLPGADPADERYNYKKETKAAALYIQDLYGTDAQASGFLVMACYNWGENQILPMLRSMPANPKERNFWKLLAMHRDKIPKQTYDYVFNIASAAVIGENPRLFGFDFDNPLAEVDAVAQKQK